MTRPPDQAPAIPPDLYVDPCTDGVVDGDETDVDCGGTTCGGCTDGLHCVASADCRSVNCQGGVCRSKDHCADGVRDDAETDVDCGGPFCGYCGLGRNCVRDADCKSGLCVAFKCAAPSPRKLAFTTGASYPVGVKPMDLAVADFNRDGRADLVVANNGSSDVTVLLGKGDGTFTPGPTLSAGVHPLVVTTADANGDRKADIVVSGNWILGAVVRLGRGDGTFGPEVETPAMAKNLTIWGFGAGDLDGDGKDDLVIGNLAANSELPIFVAAGLMGAYKVDLTVKSSGCRAVYLADVDGDRRLDAVTFSSGNGLSVHRGDGKGHLGAAQLFAAMNACEEGAVFDLDRDGALDAIDCRGNVHFGKRDGTFEMTLSFPIGGTTRPVVADFDRDGFADIAQANGNSVLISRGMDGRSFRGSQAFTWGASYGDRLAVADFDGDDLPDLAVPDYQSNKVFIVLNTSK